MYSHVWVAVHSYLHGRMKMVITSGKDVLIRVLYPLTSLRSPSFQRAMRISSGVCWTRDFSSATTHLCAVTEPLRV